MRAPAAAVLQRALLLLLVAVVSAAWPYPQAVNKNEGDACKAPDGRQGTCREISECPALLALLGGRPSQAQIIMLNRARCGFKGNIPIVCCAGLPTSPSPPPPPTKPPATPLPEFDDEPDEVPSDVSRHPNLRLLPLDRCSPGAADRVVGGKVADLFAYPWMARLGYRSTIQPRLPPSYRCGGSLINERYVLTAAHCVMVKNYRLATVKLGEHTIDTVRDCRVNSSACLPPPVDRDVEQTIVHPGYDSAKMHNDIALVRLARPVDIVTEDFVRPVCLPVSQENQLLRLDKMPLVVAGWGTTETGEASNTLMDVYIPVVPLRQCKEDYKKLTKASITSRQLCAGGVAGKDSCSGDSGGPLMLDADVEGETKTVQFGVVSFGPRNCGSAGIPGVYTRVAYYMDWILDTMRP